MSKGSWAVRLWVWGGAFHPPHCGLGEEDESYSIDFGNLLQ